jgi:hypothetical protein
VIEVVTKGLSVAVPVAAAVPVAVDPSIDLENVMLSTGAILFIYSICDCSGSYRVLWFLNRISMKQSKAKNHNSLAHGHVI